MDEIDRQILELLQGNARIPAAEVARAIGLAPSAVHYRIRRLEDTGVIQGYETRIDPKAIDRGLLSYVRVQTGEGAKAQEITEALCSIPGVQEVHRVVGEDCFFVKVRVRDTEAPANLLDHQIQRIPNLASTRTTIVLTTAKESRLLPIGTHGKDLPDGEAQAPQGKSTPTDSTPSSLPPQNRPARKVGSHPRKKGPGRPSRRN
jgi:Lrp/AsnC family leucine-responsive transcriptional regulator